MKSSIEFKYSKHIFRSNVLSISLSLANGNANSQKLNDDNLSSFFSISLSRFRLSFRIVLILYVNAVRASNVGRQLIPWCVRLLHTSHHRNRTHTHTHGLARTHQITRFNLNNITIIE